MAPAHEKAPSGLETPQEPHLRMSWEVLQCPSTSSSHSTSSPGDLRASRVLGDSLT